MGLGLWTSEEIKHDPNTGALLTMNTWDYKPPAAKDIPQDFRVTLLKGSRNPMGVMSSKGAPSIILFEFSHICSLYQPLESLPCLCPSVSCLPSRRPSTLQGQIRDCSDGGLSVSRKMPTLMMTIIFYSRWTGDSGAHSSKRWHQC